MTEKPLERLAVFSDIHAGDGKGLFPKKGFIDDNGLIIYPGEHQAALWEFRDECIAWMKKKMGRHKYAVAINGDLVQGKPHNAVSSLPNPEDQANLAYMLLKPLRDMAERFYVIRGTESHGGKSGQWEESVARRLKADSDTHIKSHWILRRRMGDKLIELAHHIGASGTPVGQATALVKAMANHSIEAVRWGREQPSLVVRSHRHTYHLYETASKKGALQVVTTPAWQLDTPFKHKTAVEAYPHIGMVIFQLNSGGEIDVSWKVEGFDRFTGESDDKEL